MPITPPATGGISRPDGSEIQVLTVAGAVLFRRPRRLSRRGPADITERRKAEARIAYMAHHDGRPIWRTASFTGSA